MNREIYATDEAYTLLLISDENRENYIEFHRQLNGEQTLYDTFNSRPLYV